MEAFDKMLTEIESPEVSPFAPAGIVETITITKAKSSEAIASLELIMARDDAKEMVEDGLNEAYETMADIVKTRKMVTLLVATGKNLAGVEVEEEPPKKRAKGKGKAKAE